jgi:histidinol-phosphate aminotransferase
MSFDPTQVIRPEVSALTAYAAPAPPGEGQVKLDANESPFALGQAPRGALAAELAKALADVALHRYPDPDARALRTLLADELGVRAEQLVLTNGSDEGIQLLEMAAGGPVLIPAPTFVMYEHTAQVLGLRLVKVPLTDSFELDRPAVRAALARERPRLVFLAWPNNPTGRLFDAAAVEEVLRLCAGEACQAVVAVDEAYADYSGRTFLDRLDRHPNLVVRRSCTRSGRRTT